MLGRWNDPNGCSIGLDIHFAEKVYFPHVDSTCGIGEWHYGGLRECHCADDCRDRSRSTRDSSARTPDGQLEPEARRLSAFFDSPGPADASAAAVAEYETARRLFRRDVRRRWATLDRRHRVADRRPPFRHLGRTGVPRRPGPPGRGRAAPSAGDRAGTRASSGVPGAGRSGVRRRPARQDRPEVAEVVLLALWTAGLRRRSWCGARSGYGSGWAPRRGLGPHWWSPWSCGIRRAGNEPGAGLTVRSAPALRRDVALEYACPHLSWAEPVWSRTTRPDRIRRRRRDAGAAAPVPGSLGTVD